MKKKKRNGAKSAHETVVKSKGGVLTAEEDLSRKSSPVEASGSSRQYLEDDGYFIDHEVDGMGFLDEYTDESIWEDDMHQEVSSSDTSAFEGDVENQSFGLEEPPKKVKSGQNLEIVEGFDKKILEMDRETAVSPEKREETLLDAWYAEYSDNSMLGLMSKQKSELTEQMMEVVIGQDDRIQISNTTQFPWRAICSLRITAGDGSQWIGTGWMVSPRTVITAGHCIYIHNRGGWVKSVQVIPGRNGGSMPYGSGVATSFRSVLGWTRDKNRNHDYGAIILPHSYDIGKTVGYFGYASLGFQNLLNLHVNLSGYPGDKPVGTQWWHARSVHIVTPHTLVYNIDTAGGQSGSPVWRLQNGVRHVVGIHTNGSLMGNSATRITGGVFNNIQNWKQQGM